MSPFYEFLVFAWGGRLRLVIKILQLVDDFTS